MFCDFPLSPERADMSRVARVEDLNPENKTYKRLMKQVWEKVREVAIDDAEVATLLAHAAGHQNLTMKLLNDRFSLLKDDLKKMMSEFVEQPLFL